MKNLSWNSGLIEEEPALQKGAKNTSLRVNIKT